MNEDNCTFKTPKYHEGGKNKKLLYYIQGSLDNSLKMKNMAYQHIDSFNYAMTNIKNPSKIYKTN